MNLEVATAADRFDDKKCSVDIAVGRSAHMHDESCGPVNYSKDLIEYSVNRRCTARTCHWL